MAINFFDNNDRMSGSVTMNYDFRERQESDAVLLEYLTRTVEMILSRGHASKNAYSANLAKNSLRDLLSGLPVKPTSLRYLKEGNPGGNFVCAKLKQGNDSTKVPIDYLCAQIEKHLSRCIAFEYESFIVAVISLKAGFVDETSLSVHIGELLKKLDLSAGISYSFDDLSKIRLYYRQSGIAMEIGYSINPDSRNYHFDSYVLDYMMSQCINELPPESLLPKGIHRLLTHDLTSQVSYISTLRTYLNNNMNVAHTAKELFIHRSTFLERLKRIQSLLDMDLGDPNRQMQVFISLRILEVADKLSARFHEAGIPDSGDHCEKHGKLLEFESVLAGLNNNKR
jgi:hypothetical protein